MTADGPRLRSNVVELLAYHDPHRSDFSCKPWRLYCLDDGRPFTAEESALANSATPAEVAAGFRLALAGYDRLARKRAAAMRVAELLSVIPGWGDMPILEAVKLLPEPARAEVEDLLDRYGPFETPG